MKKSKKRLEHNALTMKIASNLVLGVLVLSVGALCLSPIDSEVNADSESQIYRSAENGTGVSLMFNVYWGTESVYRILEILKEHEAKATFFVGGCWADDNVDCLKKIYADGHEIGNHGYFHKDHSKLNLADNQKEIAECNRFIELAIGVKPRLFAPPSGAYGNDMLTVCTALNMQTVLWSKDTIDWRDKNPSITYTRATKNVQKGDFILMHPMETTVDALDDILKYYENNHLQTVTVSENLQNEG